ncbi:SDR family NAD(P)-dependent oxidoreductase [Nitrospinota bacterium]
MLEDKVAMISGGSRGIGFHIARDLADEGCHVAISGRKEADLKRAADEIAELEKGKVVTFLGDMTQKSDCESFLGAAAGAFGGVDILVNNVGGSDPKSLLETTDEDWDVAFEFNLYNAVRLSRLVIPEMKKRGGGSILNIASIAGRESGSAMTYNASKAAMISFSKALSQQVAKDGIRVNSLAPGGVFFPGGVWERRMAAAPDGLKGFVESAMPLGRFGRPEEISAIAAFMVSPRASLVHGACWNVDGCQSRSNI